MGKVLSLAKPPRDGRGTVHVYPLESSRYEIGHESRSGSSWGYFSQYDDPAEAVAAAYRLNNEGLGGECDVFINPLVLAALPVTPGPSEGFF